MMRVRSLSAFIAAAAVALLAGCASSPAPRATLFDEAHAVAGMLANYERLASTKTEDQRNEISTAQAAFEQTPNDTTRLNLALAMLLPRAPGHDEARIQSLLSGIRKSPQHSAHHDLAQLLLRLMAERQSAQRDDQRKQDQLLQQLHEEQRKSEEMQQKIEALLAIDKEMRMRRKEP